MRDTGTCGSFSTAAIPGRRTLSNEFCGHAEKSFKSSGSMVRAADTPPLLSTSGVQVLRPVRLQATLGRPAKERSARGLGPCQGPHTPIVRNILGSRTCVHSWTRCFPLPATGNRGLRRSPATQEAQQSWFGDLCVCGG